MRRSSLADCPHCHASFHVSEQQLESADGQVRCGNCFQVFNGLTGEVDFVAPALEPVEPGNTLANLELAPMDTAELPNLKQRAPLALLVLVMLLSLSLAGQWAWQRWLQARSPAAALSISQLVVRGHPQQQQVLQLNAILNNSANAALPYPALFLYFNNRYGERQAQRLLQPVDYLRGELTQTSSIPARARVQVSLLLEDPGPGAVNYGLSLLAASATTD